MAPPSLYLKQLLEGVSVRLELFGQITLDGELAQLPTSGQQFSHVLHRRNASIAVVYEQHLELVFSSSLQQLTPIEVAIVVE